MKVLKFGGTSVGTAERMKKLIPVISDNFPCIVVLSAMSGTTDKLSKLSSYLYEQDNSNASRLINAMQEQYSEVVAGLYSDEAIIKKALDMLNSHFDYLRTFTMDMFSQNIGRTISR